MKAAASAAASASSMPAERRDARRHEAAAARASGMFSGSVATTRGAPAGLLAPRFDSARTRDVPVGVAAAVVARKIEHQQREVEAAADHGGEGRRHRRLLRPDEGVVVERIGDRHEVAERRLHPRLLAPASSGRKRTRRPTAASAISDASPPEQLIERGRRPAAARAHAEASASPGTPGSSAARGTPTRREERRRRRLRAGDRGGVRDRRGARLLRAPDRHRHDRLAAARARGAPVASKRGDVVDALDMQADRGDARVLEQPRRRSPTGRSAPGCRRSTT